MCSPMTFISLCLPSKIPVPLHPRLNFSFSGNALHISTRNPRHCTVSASIAEGDSGLELSWITWDKATPENYNGWAAEEEETKPVEKKGKSLNAFAVIGFGASVLGVIGLLAYFSLSSKGFGFRLRSPLDAFHGFPLHSFFTNKYDNQSEEASSDVLLEDAEVPAENLNDVSEASEATETSFDAVKEQKFDCIIVPFVVDSAQQEAFLALQKLKVIEYDASANELCTRREYARWLVRANSQLERSRKHRINSPAALSGTTISAFDDVGVEDPDFKYIQSLAEAGIVRSKLSNGNSGSNPNKVGEHILFFPERLVSRQDLVSWKAKIEYDVPGTNEKMSRKNNIGFLDMKDIFSDVLPELYMDIRADEKSIIRSVFGQSKRLQPSKPCTKAQAAVALTSGRLTEFIQAELSRLEAEYIARQNEMHELRSEFLERGDIQKYWEGKMEEERHRGLEVKTDYLSTISALEEEKTLQENGVAVFEREKAALDCHEQLLLSLRAEVTYITEKFSSENAKYIEEQREVEGPQNDLQVNYEKMRDTKSILEAEVEALRILRSWVEDEARRSQTRSKVLEEAGRRWKWDG